MDQYQRITTPRHPVTTAQLNRYLTQREIAAIITHQAAQEPTFGGWSYDFGLLQWVYRASQWE